MKLLILGGTGAMGKPLVDILSRNKNMQIDVTSRTDRKSIDNVSFIRGNARDSHFLKQMLLNRYDCIVDFMNYDLDEFADRIPWLLPATSLYIWFSSCRVYADSNDRLKEESPRLLDVSPDSAFLSTNRYALRKARQEDLLRSSGFANYTIIRPYITYNDDRLQLGILEKEQWLYRLLKGKPLVVSKTMLDKTTTLTFGNDVAAIVAKLIGHPLAKKEIIQIAGRDTIRWIDLLTDIYVPIIEKYLGHKPIIYASDSIKAIEMLYEGGYNTIYDRNYNRKFDSSKVCRMLGSDVAYTQIKEGISNCLTNFLSNSIHSFRSIDPIYEA